MQKIHFHSFDAFRFFAFFKVYIFHATAIVVASEGSALQWVKDHISHGGGIGVSFFFVLSGFLITYILTHDKIKFGNIKLKKFFVRRAFRIWPLFYLMVIIAFLIPPDFAKEIGYHMNGGGYDPDPWFSFTFTENYKMLLMDNVPKTTPLSVFWSLCIEEHFYIVWMLVFFIMPRKGIPYFLGASILLAIIMRYNHAMLYDAQRVANNDLFTNMDYFAISGLLGYAVAVNYKRVEQVINKIPFVVKAGYVVLLIVVLLNQKFIFSFESEFMNTIKYTIYSLMFAILLALFVPKGSKMRFSETNILTRLGKISYGLYVYHIIWIHVVYKYYLDHEIVMDSWKPYLIFLSITFTGTIVSSILSWKFFEQPLLNYREKLFPTNS